jgi:dipeptidyl aminopeptidase/acylaminoacyl peptidase
MSKLEERESIVLTNNGQKIFGILHLPKQKPKAPCVLICHGLGGNKSGHFRVYVELAERLAKEEIASFRIDFRGSGDSEGNFGDMTLTGEIADAIVALKFLASHPRIDAERIGVFGRSLGGSVAVLAAAEYGLVASIVLWAPVFDGSQWQDKWSMVSQGLASETESEEWRRINGQVASLPFYSEMFDMHILEKLKKMQHVPLLLIHGQQDEIISFAHSEMYIKARQHLRVPTELIRLPMGDHHFSLPAERALAVEQTVQWFRSTL